MFNLYTVMILKRMSESIFFQINKFTACKTKDKKEVANSLMGLNLVKIIIHLKQRRIWGPSET